MTVKKTPKPLPQPWGVVGIDPGGAETEPAAAYTPSRSPAVRLPIRPGFPASLPPTRLPGPMSTPRALTPLEQLLLRDSRPGYPMCFFLACDVVGPLDTGRLKAALGGAAGRHPLLCSRVHDTWWRPAWRLPDTLPELQAFPLGSPIPAGGEAGFPWRPIDLRRTSGVRMVALERARGMWEVVLMIQHAACDGLAGLEFFGDVWSRYHGSEPAPFRTPSRVITRRSDGGKTTPESPSDVAPPLPVEAPSAGDLGGETARFAGFLPARIARGPAALPPSRPEGAGRAPLAAGPPLPYHTCGFTAEETATIKQRAAAAGASLNDVAIAAVMRAVAAWNDDAGHPARQIRITMPVSLKAAGTRAPACNDMGYAFLDRTVEPGQDPADLIRSLATASRWIQEHRAAAVFLETLALIDRCPPLLWLLTRLPLPLSTGVVSFVGNVGPRMRANVPRDGGCDLPGGLRIRAVRGVPPIRPGTRLGVGLVIYDGRLQVTTITDSPALGPAAAARLAGAIHAGILRCAASLPASSSRPARSPPGDEP